LRATIFKRWWTVIEQVGLKIFKRFVAPRLAEVSGMISRLMEKVFEAVSGNDATVVFRSRPGEFETAMRVEKRPGQALPLELEGFEPKQFSWEEKIQRELNGGVFPTVPAQKSITLRPHQLAAVEAIFSANKNGYPGFLLADDVGLGKTFAAWAAILKIVENSHEKWKILIVCPLGVVANWRSSIQWMGTNRRIEEVVILNYERLGKIFEAKPRKRREEVEQRRAGSPRRGK